MHVHIDPDFLFCNYKHAPMLHDCKVGFRWHITLHASRTLSEANAGFYETVLLLLLSTFGSAG